MIRTLAAQAAGGKLAQIGHQQPEELLFRIWMPVPPFMEKDGDVLGAGSHSFYLPVVMRSGQL
jgi:hypothetical protein